MSDAPPPGPADRSPALWSEMEALLREVADFDAAILAAFDSGARENDLRLRAHRLLARIDAAGKAG